MRVLVVEDCKGAVVLIIHGLRGARTVVARPRRVAAVRANRSRVNR